MQRKHYGSIDGLRVVAAIGIVMMHMRANNNYEISGYVYDVIVPSLTDFLYLFMTISAFGMCCGYYEKVLAGKVDWSEFYGKRFMKVLPFFGFLVLLDNIISPSRESMYEGFANLTLLFGFLPYGGNITVIGVGWFLGLIFVFYLLFSFYCVLLKTKKRAWMVFGISLIYNFVCSNYFDTGIRNILYCSCYFIAGGLIYLYREQLSKWNHWIAYILAGCSVVVYFLVGGSAVTCLLVSGTLVISAINHHRCRVLENRITKFLGRYSMEIYLSHMFIFRIIEKLGLNHVIGNRWPQYCITVLLVFVMATGFSVMMQRIIKKAEKKFRRVKA